MRCRCVLAECGAVNEIPDAIGWRRAVQSILVECKTSRSDFFADRSKYFRRNPEQGMGMARYMMTPPKLVRPEELPAGWGLLEAHARCVRVVRASEGFKLAPRAERNERHLLMAELGLYQAAFEPGFRIVDGSTCEGTPLAPVG